MPIIIAIVVLVVAVIVGTFFFKEETTVTTNPAPLPETEPSTTELSEYADGTYRASGTYNSPAGTEHIDISITLTGDVVTAATFEGHAENPGSVFNQSKFSQGYAAAVVGKDIDTIALTVVNGSSLTPTGFMNALSKIKTEARI